MLDAVKYQVRLPSFKGVAVVSKKHKSRLNEVAMEMLLSRLLRDFCRRECEIKFSVVGTESKSAELVLYIE